MFTFGGELNTGSVRVRALHKPQGPGELATSLPVAALQAHRACGGRDATNVGFLLALWSLRETPGSRCTVNAAGLQEPLLPVSERFLLEH